LGVGRRLESIFLPTRTGTQATTLIQSIDARNNIVFSKDAAQHIALLGVENLIIVNTGDALLVCPRDQAERLKELVAGLPPALQ
jgi:mannose-1-phosphate guanylyltransferase